MTRASLSQHASGTAPRRTPLASSLRTLLPGVALTAGIAAVATGLRAFTGVTVVSPMILSLIAGMLLHNLAGVPASTRPGIAFSLKRILRLGIVLLGFQVTLSGIVALGGGALAVTAITLIAAFVAIRIAGPLIGVDRPLTELIAAGTAVCGASAVIATNTVSRASEEDVAYAVACVSILGSASMLIYPLLAGPLGMDAVAYGLWTGATVHEVAQVAAAAFQHSDAAGQVGTVAKLTRVLMLAPLIFCLAGLRTSGEHEGGTRTQMPWFVLGFVLLVAFNSTVALPQEFTAGIGTATGFLLSMALAAMGLQINFGKLRAKGIRPLLLGIFGWLFIALFGLAAMRLWGF